MLALVGKHISVAWVFIAVTFVVLSAGTTGRASVIFAGTGVVLFLLILIRAISRAERERDR